VLLSEISGAGGRGALSTGFAVSELHRGLVRILLGARAKAEKQLSYVIADLGSHSVKVGMLTAAGPKVDSVCYLSPFQSTLNVSIYNTTSILSIISKVPRTLTVGSTLWIQSVRSPSSGTCLFFWCLQNCDA